MFKEGRIFIKEGNLMKVCRKESKQRYFVFLSDILIYGNKGTLNYELHRVLDVSFLTIKDIQDTNGKYYY